MMKSVMAALFFLLLSGCAQLREAALPKSIGEVTTSYTYVPLDPIPVATNVGNSCLQSIGTDLSTFESTSGVDPKFPVKLRSLLDSLPDNAVRMAVKHISGDAKLSFGASSLGIENNRYQVILDYVNVDATNIRFAITSETDAATKIKTWSVKRIPALTEKNSSFLTTLEKNASDADGNIVIPVYVGVGLRLTADIRVLKGTINLASLGAVAANVEAGNASGSLVVQTIGVTGKQVSVSLPMPSELNQTTVQNAILSLGAIKAIIYDENSATVTPRVIGIYLPVREGDDDLVNRIVSELARYPIPWTRGCKVKDTL